MSRRSLSIAVGDYFHVRHLVDGRVDVPGLDLVWVQLQNEQILQRAFQHREWDASEFSLAQYVALRSQGDDSLIALPVFPSRVFRHSSIFVRRGGIERPEQLHGARIGVPEWVQTAGVWARGILVDDFGLDLTSVDWVQGGVFTPGRKEHVTVTLPDGIHVRAEADRSLSDLLSDGQLDAIISARAPAGFSPTGPIGPLFRNARERELEWGLRNRTVPIMHVVVLRRDVYEQAPWSARGLYDGFAAAKKAALAALSDLTVSVVPVPWVGEEPDRLSELFDGEWWPYGVEPNRASLSTFVRHARDQGVAVRDLEIESLFAPETLGEVRI